MGLRKQVEYLSALRKWVTIDLVSSQSEQKLYLELIDTDMNLLLLGKNIIIEKYEELNNILSELGKTQLHLLQTEITLSKMGTSCFTLLAASKFKRNLTKSKSPYSSPKSVNLI